MMTTIAVNSKDAFRAEVLENPGTVLAGFTAEWCPYCKAKASLLSRLADKTNDYKFCRIDVDKAVGIDDAYGVMAIPTLMVFKNGKPSASKMIAYLDDVEIENFINSHI